MTATTTYYNLILYNNTTDNTALFSVYRHDLAGVDAGTNMVEIDSILKDISDRIAFKRQGAATGANWGNNPGTTNYTPTTDVYVQFGVATTDTPTGTKHITFPTPFASVPLVLVSAIGVGDVDTESIYAECSGVTTTGFYGHIKKIVLSNATITEATVGWTAEIQLLSANLNWIAIGTI